MRGVSHFNDGLAPPDDKQESRMALCGGMRARERAREERESVAF